MKDRLTKQIIACDYQKQVNSNKARYFTQAYNILMISTIISTVILAAIGFSNQEEISNLLGIQRDSYHYLINISALIVLILSLLNLLLRFQEKSVEHYKAVVTLASLIREMKLLIVKLDRDDDITNQFELLNQKYSTILEYLPQHSDKDFMKAKMDLKKKKQLSEEIKNSRMNNWCIRKFLFFSCLMKSKDDTSN